MTPKRENEIKKLIEEAGAKLATPLELNGGGHPTCFVEAPSGQRKRVSFGNTPSDHMGDVRQLSYVRKFVRDNPATVSPIVAALTKAVKKEEFKVVPQLLTRVSPKEPAESAPPPMAPSYAKPSDFATNKPVAESKPKAKIERNRLTLDQALDLADFLRSTYKWAEAKPWKYEQVAEAAHIELGFTVNANNVETLCKRYGLKLSTKPLELLTTFTPEGAVQVLIHQLEELCKSNKVKPTAQFTALAESFAAGRGFKTR